jgi:hypothetical protein
MCEISGSHGGEYEVQSLVGLLPSSQTDVDLDVTTRQYIPEDCELKTLQLFPLSA